ncbi:MAG: hypothetical protein ACI9HY_004012 [Planctomycetaceae bacterium]|jgi:hypothetical protein
MLIQFLMQRVYLFLEFIYFCFQNLFQTEFEVVILVKGSDLVTRREKIIEPPDNKQPS